MKLGNEKRVFVSGFLSVFFFFISPLCFFPFFYSLFNNKMGEGKETFTLRSIIYTHMHTKEFLSPNQES